MKLNKYIKKNRFKAIKMDDRRSLMNCYKGIKDKGGYDEIECDTRNRNWFGVVNNGFLTYYFINT